MRRKYDPAQRAALEDALHQRRANGETFEQICAGPGWPSRPTLQKWLRERPELAMYAAAARRVRRRTTPYPFDPRAADALITRVKFGEPIGRLIGQPGLPHRRQLTAWKAAHPEFAARLAEAVSIADASRRRFGPHRRRSWPAYDDEALKDRIILALLRGATLPSLYRDPSFPNRTGFARWRRIDPEWSEALHGATKLAHIARGRARAAAQCTPAFTAAVEQRLIHGASLAGLGDDPAFPSRTTLYRHVRTNPAFAAAVAKACEFRDTWLLADAALDALDRGHPRQAAALRKRLGQLNPHPGAKRRERGKR